MNRLFSGKAALAAVAFGALALGSAAHAADVSLSIGIPFGYVQPAPVYVEPQPVYVQPRTVYVQPEPVYVQPRPVYVQPRHGYYDSHRYDSHRYDTHRYDSRRHDSHRPDRRVENRSDAWDDADRDGIPNLRDRDWRHYDARATHRWAMTARPGDADGDGVPNTRDRSPHNPARR